MISLSAHLMKTKHLLPVLMLIPILSACSQSSDTEKKFTTRDSVYRYEPVGWEMVLPEGYEFMSEQDGKSLQQKGLDAMQETAGEDFQPDPVNNLLNFRKDRQNVFLSTSQHIDLDGVPYEDINNEVITLMVQTYKDNNLGVIHTQGKEIIDGKEFIRDEFELTTPDNKYLLNQVMYSRLFGSIELSATITWNNEKYGKEMLRCWRRSKFTDK